MRNRAFRRFQLRQAKRRARNLWVRIWQMQDYIGDRWDTRLGYYFSEPDKRWVGIQASTHCKPCSCHGCGNARRHEGPTIQERRASQPDWEPCEALDPNRTAQPRARHERTKAERIARKEARRQRLKEKDEQFAKIMRELRQKQVG